MTVRDVKLTYLRLSTTTYSSSFIIIIALYLVVSVFTEILEGLEKHIEGLCSNQLTKNVVNN